MAGAAVDSTSTSKDRSFFASLALGIAGLLSLGDKAKLEKQQRCSHFQPDNASTTSSWRA